ncbi:MAG: leucine-rich repeat domain-containing protein, partial [Clostridia bacterium]|nr:leucine-rich repeat domain-containing protein [Clostridia bacterium]
LNLISVPSTTASIGAYAFKGTLIKAFNIPSSITEIAPYTFASTHIETITIPASVTFIGEGAFNKASKLSSITFRPGASSLVIGSPDTEVGGGVFEGTALVNVTLPQNISGIGAYTFTSISTLRSVTIPSGARIETIGAYAFYNTKLTSVTLNDGLVEIGASAFEGTNLMAVTIPSTVKYIRNSAFKCQSLSSITFKNGTETDELYIEDYAFRNTKIATINFPRQLKELGHHDEQFNFQRVDLVFEGNTALHTITVNEDNTIYHALDGVLYIYGATEDQWILNYCPRYKTGELIVPTNVYSVSARAFYTTSLTKVIFAEFDKDDERYGQPLLTIGSFANQINNDTDYPVFGHNPMVTNPAPSLQYIHFPSHTAALNSYAIGKFSYTADFTIEVDFNPDASVAFKYSAIRGSNVGKISFPKITELSTYCFYGMSNGNLSYVYFAPGSTYVDIPRGAFESNATGLTSFDVPATVTSIGDFAFKSCSNLKTINFLGDNVLTFGDQAFAQTGFESFVFPSSVLSVGEKLLYNCQNLKTITINGNITSYDTMVSMHENCLKLEKFVVPSNHKTLKTVNGALLDKAGQTLIACPSNNGEIFTVPNGVMTISAGAFHRFTGATVILPNTLVTIGNKAFEYSSIQLMIIPGSVKTIGDNAFAYCSSLSSLAFAGGSKLNTIGKQAFLNSGITGIDIPDTVNSVAESAFAGCTKLTSAILPAGLKAIPKKMFSGCTTLTYVTFQEGLTSIGSEAFKNCQGILTIELPSTIKTIAMDGTSSTGGKGKDTFLGCTSLYTVDFGANSALTSIGNTIFSGCTQLTNVYFGDKLTSIGTDIFKNCTSLTTLRLSNAMTSIPQNFLSGCSNITSVNIPTSVKSIGSNAFKDCKGLTSIVFENVITSIGSGAFSGCTELTSVEFNGGATLTSISNDTFANTTKLTSINIPASVTSIGTGAFKNSAIENVSFTTKLTSIGADAFNGCKGLTNVSIPYSVTSIGARAFKDCENIEILSLTAGINSIGDYAFENCAKIEEIYLPATLKTLGSNPFSGCINLANFNV